MSGIKILLNKIATLNKKLFNIVYESYLSLRPLHKLLLVTVLIIATILFIIPFWTLNKNKTVEIMIEGGELIEGIIGYPSIINPLLAVSDIDRDLSSLIYSGLLRIDQDGNLITDLAEKYEISDNGLEYLITLKKNLTWQDGQKLTTEDIAYTIKKIQNPLIKSPRRNAWDGVETQLINELQIKFILKKPYAPFLYNLTLGIIPEHIWGEVPLENFNISSLNLSPIGSGPYLITKIKKSKNGLAEYYDLKPFKNFSLGSAKIEKIRLKFFANQEELLKAIKQNQVNAWHNLSLNGEEFKTEKQEINQLTLPRIFNVFLNYNQAEIFKYPEIREALNLATCREIIVEQLTDNGFKKAIVNNDPFFIDKININNNEENTWEKRIELSKEILNKENWQNNEAGILSKTIINDKKINKEIELSFSLTTSDSPEMKKAAETLKGCWEKIGAKVEILTYDSGRLNQDFIPERKFEALLFGLAFNHDPDPFAYWHSSQRFDLGLNIASYMNLQVDQLLEESRTIIEPEERRAVYQEIIKQIREDNPAIFIYSPQFSYFLPKEIKGVKIPKLLTPSERFSQVYDWYLKTDKVWRIFADEQDIIK